MVSLEDRATSFSLAVIRHHRYLLRDDAGRILAKQLLRCATSIGANLAEAQGGHSKADYIAKTAIAYKEARETLYWLRLLRQAGLGDIDKLKSLSVEADSLARILASCLITAKQNSGRGKIVA